MFDLNELFLYAKVVEHGGFAAAGRALNLPKSTLSRRVSQLEARLGARLIQRSTRQFQVTDIGQAYYRHCVAMIAEAESAEDVIAFNKSEPRGVIRLSCTTALLNYWVAPMLAQFMAQCASVELNVKSFNRKVDIIPLLQYLWDLTGPGGATAQVAHTPRLVSDDMSTLKNAALAGVGIANLPKVVVKDELADGRLIAVLPEWQPAEGVITAVFPSRRGLMPSVRSLIDFLGDAFEAP